MSATAWHAWSDAGVATLELPTGERLTYGCQPDLHCVVVRDGGGHLRFGFGGFGSRPGQFDTPLDVVLVAPRFQGEWQSGDARETAWLAVADYGNRRVQIFDLDGCFVGTVAETQADQAGAPSRLAWRDPMLVVDGVDGARTVVDLTAALLNSSRRCQTMRPVLRTRAALSRETH